MLLDLRLPKIDGLQVLKEVKAYERLKTIPVVVLTSSKETPEIAACYELGANSYVSKPVEFTAFAEVVAKLGLYWVLVNELPER